MNIGKLSLTLSTLIILAVCATAHSEILGDINNDGVVNELDLMIFQQHWHDSIVTQTPTDTPTIVPTETETPTIVQPTTSATQILNTPTPTQTLLPTKTPNLPAGNYIRVLPCKTSAPFGSQVSCYVDIVDNKGNILNKDFLSQSVQVTVDISGNAIGSSLAGNQIIVSSAKGAFFYLLDNVAETVTISGSAPDMPAYSSYQVEFIPSGMISGKVIRADNQTPVVQANVSVYSGTFPNSLYVASQMTDINGYFEVKGLTPGEYDLLVKDYAMIYNPHCGKTGVLVNANQTTEVGNIELDVLQGGANITGNAHLPQGYNWQADALIGYAYANYNYTEAVNLCERTLYFIGSIANGQYLISKAMPGNYLLYAYVNNPQRHLTFVPSIQSSYEVEVAGTEPVVGPDIYLEKVMDVTAAFPLNYETVYNPPVFLWQPPAGLGSNVRYSISVQERCGNTVWYVTGGIVNTSILYGQSSQYTAIEPQPISNTTVYNWSVTAVDGNGKTAQPISTEERYFVYHKQ